MEVLRLLGTTAAPGLRSLPVPVAGYVIDPMPQAPDELPTTATRRWLENQPGSWLLVFDNAPENAGHGAVLRAMLPQRVRYAGFDRVESCALDDVAHLADIAEAPRGWT